MIGDGQRGSSGDTGVFGRWWSGGKSAGSGGGGEAAVAVPVPPAELDRLKSGFGGGDNNYEYISISIVCVNRKTTVRYLGMLCCATVSIL